MLSLGVVHPRKGEPPLRRGSCRLTGFEFVSIFQAGVINWVVLYEVQTIAPLLVDTASFEFVLFSRLLRVPGIAVKEGSTLISDPVVVVVVFEFGY